MPEQLDRRRASAASRRIKRHRCRQKRLRWWKSNSGQGLTEYSIIVALIAVFSIAVVTLFGDNIRALFAGSVNALAGEGNANVKTKKARSKHTRSANLKKSFGDLNP